MVLQILSYSLYILQRAIQGNVKRMNNIILLQKIIWYIGVFIFLLHTIRSYFILKEKLQSAVLLRDNIYITQTISTPFAIGLRNPKIYLPNNLASTQEYVIAHERAHLSRHDNLAKVIGYAILVLHWFNPLVWIAFKLFVTDMEMSCDESVIRKAKTDIRKEVLIL